MALPPTATRRLRAAGLITLALAALPTAAAGASSLTQTLSAASAVERADCATTDLGNAAGVAHSQFTAPFDGVFTFQLSGDQRSDWDLRVMGAGESHQMGSGQFGIDEVVQMLMYKGQSVNIQACRVSGARDVRLTVTSLAERLLPKGVKPATEMLVSVATPTKALRDLVNSLGLDLSHSTTADKAQLFVTAPGLSILKKAGLTPKIEIADLVAADRAARAQDRAATRAKTRGFRAAATSVPSGRTEYRKLADFQAELKKLAQDYPALVKPVVLPHKTVQGREQMGVEISSNVAATDDQKPYSFIMGVHHAREWPAGEMPMEFAHYLAKGFGTDKDVTTLLNTTRIVIVPIINPDGYVASREAPIELADNGLNPAGLGTTAEGVLPPFGGVLAYRRKNCNGLLPAGVTPCELQFGIDPNRNYGLGWGGKGASTDTGSQSYRGPGPWSEFETQSVHEFSQVHDVTSLLTVHTIAALVLRPPGISDNGPAIDEEALKKLGDAMGADTGYTSQYGYQLYDTSGTTEDWNYGAAGTWGYTIELGPSGGDFHGNYQEYVIDQWNGTEKRAGRGMRQAMLRIAYSATDKSEWSTLEGRAPAGRTLRLKKEFVTDTAAVCAIADPLVINPLGELTSCISPGAVQHLKDKLEYTTKVPANSNFSWMVTPSTRPFFKKAGKTEEWTLTCEDDAGKVYETKTFAIWRGETAKFELPCGGTLPSAAAKDRLAPKSKLTKKSLKASRKGLTLAGSTSDFAPKGLRPKVKKVAVAIGRRTGKKCQFVKANGALGPKVSCQRVGPYLAAKGTTNWTFLFKHSLKPGSYLAWVRGYDAAGNVERKDKKRNLITFKVK